jgi:hypothetical protein
MIRSTDLFTFFFSIPDKPSYDKKKKEIGKWHAPKTIFEIKHFEGKAGVSVTAESVIAGKNISAFVPHVITLYDKLMKANEDTVRVMKVLVEAVNREAEIYKELSLAHASVDVNKLNSNHV